jgi:hypothetical protein
MNQHDLFHYARRATEIAGLAGGLLAGFAAVENRPRRL